MMKRINVKITLIVLSCALLAIICFGIISVAFSTIALRESESDRLVLTARYYTEKFGQEFENVELQAQELASYVKNTIDKDKIWTDEEYLEIYRREVLIKYVKDFAERSSGKSGWVYFSPELSEKPLDIYYVDQDDDGYAEIQTYVDFSYFNTPPTPEDDKYWWLGAKESGMPVWSNPYDWKLKNGREITIVSYSIPLFFNGEFFGVAGTSYRFDEMKNDISSIHIFESGYAALYNDRLDVIIHPEYRSGTRISSDNLTTVDNQSLAGLCDTLIRDSYGMTVYDSIDGERACAFSILPNGWIFSLNPLVSEINSGARNLFRWLLVSSAGCIILSAFCAMIAGKSISRPIQELAKAARIFSTGNLSHKIKITTKDELGTLGESLNDMAQNVGELQTQLEQLAYYDPLTGLRNLSKFKKDAEQIVIANKDKSFATVKFDIDQFKVFNELHGFYEGDNILNGIKRVLNEMLDHKYELACRVVNDEFVMLLLYTGMKDFDNRRLIFESKLGALFNDSNYPTVFPIGRYYIQSGEHDFSVIYEHVNHAHRLAKHADVSKIVDYDQQVADIALREREIEVKQEAALNERQFVMYLQPKYRLSDEKVVSAEGLIRWSSPTMGMVYPDTFIPLFERNGFITQVDMFMLRVACETIGSWIDDGIEPITISVNFSRLNLGNPSFVADICKIANEYHVPHQYIEVEVTETVFLGHVGLLVTVINQLHEAGFKLSMDDFGSGYSSLGLLKNLPVDEVKLDRSFFVNTGEEVDTQKERTVITSIIEMLKKLDISTVAEGVEDLPHILFLKDLGCDMVQGYYYAKPVPVDEFTKSYMPTPCKR